MGGEKEAMLREQENRAMAASYLVSIGRLEKCEAHGTVYGGGGWDLESDFWKEVMADRNRKDNGPIPWAADLGSREFTDLLKAAYEDHPGEACFACDKLMRE